MVDGVLGAESNRYRIVGNTSGHALSKLVLNCITVNGSLLPVLKEADLALFWIRDLLGLNGSPLLV